MKNLSPGPTLSPLDFSHTIGTMTSRFGIAATTNMVSRSSELVAIPSRGMRECADESATPLAATVHAMRRLSSRNTAEAPEIRPKRLRSSAHCCLRVPRAAFCRRQAMEVQQARPSRVCKALRCWHTHFRHAGRGWAKWRMRCRRGRGVRCRARWWLSTACRS